MPIGSSEAGDIEGHNLGLSVAVLAASLSHMPPARAFGWLCVVHTVADIAFRAAQIRSVQALPKSSSQIPPTANRSHGGPTSSQSAETDTRTSLEPLLHSHVTGKVTEGSVVHEESSLPRRLNITTSYQDSVLSPKLSGAVESDVNVSTFLLNRARHKPV